MEFPSWQNGRRLALAVGLAGLVRGVLKFSKIDGPEASTDDGWRELSLDELNAESAEDTSSV